jgi:NAD(P)-dependent dehydrogenase (short-subunit alcohol dehydrogenase family)
VVVADVNGDAAAAVADEIGGLTVEADLASEAGNVAMIEAATAHGPIDLLCLNAGIAASGGVEAVDEDWYRSWNINVMAHVWAVRAALPAMVARGEGYILTTASAAGLLANNRAAPYTVTKHAAVGLAEWLSITHGDQGIKVSCLCPQGVRTPMLFPEGDSDALGDDAGSTVRAQGVIEPDELAESVIAGLEAERFLILPHPEVREYFIGKANDHDRWLGGMRKLRARFE